MMHKKKRIKSKAAAMILSISLSTTLLLGGVCGGMIAGMNKNIIDSMESMNRLALQDSTTALREQKMAELQALADNKSSLADISLTLILNQTRLVAMAAEDIFAQEEDIVTEEMLLSQAAYQNLDFSCGKPEQLGTYSIHIRAPRELMAEDSIKEENGIITQASLDLTKLIDTEAEDKTGYYRKLKEFYQAASLQKVLGGIRNFDNGDGTYNGIGATYFCLESSGIDILADTLTTEQIEYDARNSKWYQEAKKLGPGEIYWSDPTPDGSGRGIALICAMPVYAGDKLIGVAGSGGLIDNIRELVQSTAIGTSGYAFLVHQQGDGTLNLVATANPDQTSEIAEYGDNLFNTGNQELGMVLQEIVGRKAGIRQIHLDNQEVFIAYSPLQVTNWTMVTVIGINDLSISGPAAALEDSVGSITLEAIGEINTKVMMIAFSFFMVVLIVIVLTILFSYRFSERLAKPIMTLMEGAKEISGGNLDLKLSIHTQDEIEELGEAFNHMTDSLKTYIENLSAVTAEKERIGAELNVATQIQSSMLPCIFPAFPEEKKFDIYAAMQPAKEVGGDFYDFFLINETNLAVVMADVSGKGVPAALFMVIAKTLIKNYAQMGHAPADVFTAVNNQLCENNDAGMFVTGWMGILEINNKILTFTNAGHNPPLIKRADGLFTYLNAKPGFVLAGMEGIQFTQQSLPFEEGDMLYLYTDGVTEAMNPAGSLYGEERLKDILDNNIKLPLSKLLPAIKSDIDVFAEGEPQFDDITMLILRMNERE